jgi:hypothetical protein
MAAVAVMLIGVMLEAELISSAPVLIGRLIIHLPEHYSNRQPRILKRQLRGDRLQLIEAELEHALKSVAEPSRTQP